MHLQTVNRDQRGERRYPGREARRKKKLSLFPFFFFSFLCTGIVNILLCPAFLLLPFKIANFGECFLMQRWCAVLYSPSAFPSQSTFRICVFPPPSLSSFTQHFLILHLPQVRQTIPLPRRAFSPPPHTHSPLPPRLCANIFSLLTLFQSGFQPSGSTFSPSFMWTFTRRIQPAAQTL